MEEHARINRLWWPHTYDALTYTHLWEDMYENLKTPLVYIREVDSATEYQK